MTCAYAVRVALKKFSGVDSVEVSLNKGSAAVKLKAGNSIRPQEFWATIRKNGFTPKATHVLVRGQVLGGGSQFRVSGTGEMFELKTDSKLLAQLKAAPGTSVTLEGTLIPGKDAKTPVPLDVLSVGQ